MRRGSERALRLLAGVAAAALLTGGSAWALSGGVPGPGHSNAVVQAADDTSTTTSTSFDDSTTTSTSFDDSTTTTSFDDSTTTSTSFDDSSTTSTSFDAQTPTSVASCKPGWGYGDKNHCHSGPPGRGNGLQAKNVGYEQPAPSTSGAAAGAFGFLAVVGAAGYALIARRRRVRKPV